MGFILRAILAASDGAKENVGVVIAETIFFTLAFVSLLYSVFILILNRSVRAYFLMGRWKLISLPQDDYSSASAW